jgi:hypothetical protein
VWRLLGDGGRKFWVEWSRHFKEGTSYIKGGKFWRELDSGTPGRPRRKFGKTAF